MCIVVYIVFWASFTWVYCSIHPCKDCVWPHADAQVFGINRLLHFQIRVCGCTALNADSVHSERCAHTAGKLGVAAVSLHPNWHKWDCLHEDAKNTCASPMQSIHSHRSGVCCSTPVGKRGLKAAHVVMNGLPMHHDAWKIEHDLFFFNNAARHNTHYMHCGAPHCNVCSATHCT